MAQGKSINSMWDFLKPGIAGAVGGAFAAGAPSALFSSLGKNIGYGVLSGGVTGGVSDIVNGGNGSGALWGAVTGGAFAGLNWGIDRSFFENSLHDINTAMVKAGDPDDPIQLREIVVRGQRNTFLDRYAKREAVSVFFGNLSYYWSGGYENGITYDRQGYPYAYASLMGAPDLIGGPLAKGDKAIKLGKNLLNPKLWHTNKEAFLTQIGRQNFSRIVGNNPNISFKGNKIILTGVRDFKGKNYSTDFSIKEFIKWITR
jgi:hypothetical protein